MARVLMTGLFALLMIVGPMKVGIADSPASWSVRMTVNPPSGHIQKFVKKPTTNEVVLRIFIGESKPKEKTPTLVDPGNPHKKGFGDVTGATITINGRTHDVSNFNVLDKRYGGSAELKFAGSWDLKSNTECIVTLTIQVGKQSTTHANVKLRTPR